MNIPYYYYYLYIYNTILLVGVLCILPIATTHAQNKEQIINEYIIKGETEKALLFCENNIKKGDKTIKTHNLYLKLMLDVGKYNEAERYVRKRLQKEGYKIAYTLDLGLVALKAGKNKKADMILQSIIKKNSNRPHEVKNILNYLTEHRLFGYAISAILSARKKQANPLLYTFDMGYLYRIKNNKKAMIEEYLNTLVQGNSPNIYYVKNVFQITLKEKEEIETLENILYERVQQNPTFEYYLDLLIWANLQRHDFYGAYTKAKAYDMRFKKRKSKTLEVAEVALSNEYVDVADKGFTYVIEQFSTLNERIKAKLGRIQARTKKAENIPKTEKKDFIRLLIEEYQSVIEEYPNLPKIDEAILNQAKLYAYGLHEKEEAIRKLTLLINQPTINPLTKANAKLELGTLYMQQHQPWESALLYAQVAHEHRKTPVGYEAKLRNAKLYYYNGDFKLAQEHLDILKEATTREIANDAMELSLRIKENTMRDTTGARLKEYAAVERLLEEHKTDTALEQLSKLKKKCNEGTNKGDPDDKAILDDIYWLEANIRLEQGEGNKAYDLLQQIVTRFGNDVLADDALFLQGNIMEKNEKKNDAMQLYLTLINRFPGSVYVDEARKRYRKLSNTPLLQPAQ